MAHPKSKISKARKRSRNSANFNVEVPAIVSCPQCKESKQAHKVCPHCGYYDGKEVIAKKEEKKN